MAGPPLAGLLIRETVDERCSTATSDNDTTMGDIGNATLFHSQRKTRNTGTKRPRVDVREALYFSSGLLAVGSVIMVIGWIIHSRRQKKTGT